MSVRVLYAIEGVVSSVEHADAAWFATGEDGALSLRAADDKLVAVYARGLWVSATQFPAVVNAAAEPDPRSAEPYQTLTTETVLSETTEPYVSVSVTGPDPETVAKTLARLA